MTVNNSSAQNAQAMIVTFDPNRRNFTGHHATDDGHSILLKISYGEGKPNFDENYQPLRILDAILSTPGNPVIQNYEAITESHYRSAMGEFTSKVVEQSKAYLASIGIALDSEKGKASIANSQKLADYVGGLAALPFEEIKQVVRIQQIDIVEGGYLISIGTYEPMTLLIRAFLPTGIKVSPEQIEKLKAMTGDNTICPLCAVGIPHPEGFHAKGAGGDGQAAAAPAAPSKAGRTLH